MTLIVLVHLLKKAPHTSNWEWFYDKRWSEQDAFLKDKICKYNNAFMQISYILVHREIIHPMTPVLWDNCLGQHSEKYLLPFNYYSKIHTTSRL